MVDFHNMQQHLEGSARKRQVQRRMLTATGAAAAESISKGHAETVAPAGAPGEASSSARLAPTAHSSASPAAASGPSVPEAASSSSHRSIASTRPIWEFSVHNGYKPFPEECQDVVERQYQAFKHKGGTDIGKVTLASGHTFSLDFVVMRQRPEGSGRERNLRRRVEAR